MSLKWNRAGRSGMARESGQAGVESAIILPLQIFFMLCLLQLIMIQHAKIMTEYAAFQAARAGVVWNGNNERMHDAAIAALLPTMGDTSKLTKWALTFGKAELYDTALSQLGFSGLKPFNAANLIGQVRIDTINPSWYSPIGSIWHLFQGANWKELDFDGPDAYPKDPKLVQFIKGLLDPKYEDTNEENYRKSTVLQIRLRYLYEMRVPFANWMIFSSWFAANIGISLHGAVWAPSLDPKANAVKAGTLPTIGTGKGIDHQKGYNTIYPTEMGILWLLARGQVPIVSSLLGKRYFLPLSATYSMRMQSNFQRRWLMHINPSWDL